MQHDVIADALSSLKNAKRAGKEKVKIKPASNLLKNVLKVMQKYRYVGNFEFIENKRGGEIIVDLSKNLNECNVIKPRFYVKKDEFIKYEKRYLPARPMGILIVSTPEGVMSHKEAVEKGIGGSLIAYVY